MTKKVILYPIPTVLFMMHSAGCIASANGNGVNCPKCHVANHLNHLDLRNAVIEVTMMSVSHDTDTGVNGIT